MGGQILEYEGKTIFNEGKREGLQEGRKEGRQEGVNEEKQRMATDMLRDGESLEKL